MSLFGRKPAAPPAEARPDDEQAIERYRYLLKTAPPETIERAHAEAFAQLTPEQRRQVLQRMSETVPPSERPLVEQARTNPEALARLATRQEIRQPGTMERMFGQAGSTSLGGLMAGTLLSSIAGTVLGSIIAREFFDRPGHGAAAFDDTAQPGEDARFDDTDQATGDDPSYDDLGGDTGTFDV